MPERQKRTQQGILLDNVNFAVFDLDKYNIRNAPTRLHKPICLMNQVDIQVLHQTEVLKQQ